MTDRNVEQIIRIADGIETNNPVLAANLRKLIVEQFGASKAAKEIMKQRRTARKQQKINNFYKNNR